MKSRQFIGIIMALTAACFWGLSGTIGQYLFAQKGVDTTWLTAIRMIFAGLLLLTLAVAKYRPQLAGLFSRPWKVIRLITFAVAGLMFCQYTYFTAIRYSNSATGTALQYLGQALILIVACCQERRLPRLREEIALVLAIGGVFLLATHGDPGNLALTPQGLFWGLISAVALMLYTLLPGSLIEEYGSIPVIGSAMLLGGLILGLTARVWEIPVTLDSGALAGVIYIIVLGTAIPYTLYLQSVCWIGGVKASMFACVETVSAALATFFWLGTPLASMDWVAFGMILAMGLLLAWKGPASPPLKTAEKLE